MYLPTELQFLQLKLARSRQAERRGYTLFDPSMPCWDGSNSGYFELLLHKHPVFPEKQKVDYIYFALLRST